ncbi:MAG: 6-phosphogluconolactonase [Steroidobacteraceae bacterium]
MILQRFASAEEAALALSEQVESALRNGLEQRGAASLAVAGGRTPQPLFRALREAHLDWSQVGVTLTDERWVSESHAGSNAALVRRELLTARAAAARFYPLYDGSAATDGAAAAVWKSLASLAQPFDAVVLGMGDDGHFASLFPDSPGLAAALNPAAPPACVAMLAPTEPTSRISLNLAALLQARRLFLFITGTHKRDLLLAASRSAGTMLPVAALLVQRVPMPEVYWAP